MQPALVMKSGTCDAAVQTETTPLFFIQDSLGKWLAVPGYRLNEDAPEIRALLSSLVNNNSPVAASSESAEVSNPLTASSPVETPTSCSEEKKNAIIEPSNVRRSSQRSGSFVIPGGRTRSLTGISFGQIDDLERILDSSTSPSKDAHKSRALTASKSVVNGDAKRNRRNRVPFREWEKQQRRVSSEDVRNAAELEPTSKDDTAQPGKNRAASEEPIKETSPSDESSTSSRSGSATPETEFSQCLPPGKSFKLNVAAKEFIPKSLAIPVPLSDGEPGGVVSNVADQMSSASRKDDSEVSLAPEKEDEAVAKSDAEVEEESERPSSVPSERDRGDASAPNTCPLTPNDSGVVSDEECHKTKKSPSAENLDHAGSGEEARTETSEIPENVAPAVSDSEAETEAEVQVRTSTRALQEPPPRAGVSTKTEPSPVRPKRSLKPNSLTASPVKPSAPSSAAKPSRASGMSANVPASADLKKGEPKAAWNRLFGTRNAVNQEEATTKTDVKPALSSSSAKISPKIVRKQPAVAALRPKTPPSSPSSSSVRPTAPKRTFQARSTATVALTSRVGATTTTSFRAPSLSSSSSTLAKASSSAGTRGKVTSSSSQSLSSNSTTSSSVTDVATKRKRIVDEEGWETVKGRSRSRFSPVKSIEDSTTTDVTHSMENLVRRGSIGVSGLSRGVRPNPISKRFLMPSGAVSLPSVVVVDELEKKKKEEPTGTKPGSRASNPAVSGAGRATVQKKVAQKANSVDNKVEAEAGSPSVAAKAGKKKVKPKKSKDDQSAAAATSPKVEKEKVATDATSSAASSSREPEANDVSQRLGNSCASPGVPTTPDMPRELNTDADAILDAQDDEELEANEQAVARVVAEEETLQEAIRLEFEKGEAEAAAERERLENDSIEEEMDDDHGSQPEELDGADGEKHVMLTVAKESSKLHRQMGRGFQLHEKLSSPSRNKVSAEERLKRHEEKQAKANELRMSRLQTHKEKMEELKRKIEEVRATKMRLLDIRRLTTERKLARAEEKRKLHLQSIVRKAHDEEEKAKEIAFINTLGAANKRQEIAQQEQILEARLQEKNDERLRRCEEKAAKEAAVEERRRALEAERLAKIDSMVRRREDRERQIAEDMTRKEELRVQLAREKAKSREERVSAINAKHVADAQKLQRKIALRHEETARRHEEKMDDIRRRAFESTVLKYSAAGEEAPSLVCYETAKMCTLCQVIIGSEVYLLSHLKGKLHRAAVGGACVDKDELGLFNLAHIVDAPHDDEHYKKQVRLDVDRQKACRKRCGKIKHRMHLRSKEFAQWWSASNNQGSGQGRAAPSSGQIQGSTKKSAPAAASGGGGGGNKDPEESKFVRSVKDVERLVEREGRGMWEDGSVSTLERNVTLLMRLMKSKPKLKAVFGELGGFAAIQKILGVVDQAGGGDGGGQLWIPIRCLVHAAELWLEACDGCPDNCLLVLYSDAVVWLADHVIKLLNRMIPEYASFVPGCTPTGPRSLAALTVDPLVACLVQILTKIFVCLRGVHLGLPSPSFSSSSSSSPSSPSSGVRSSSSVVKKPWKKAAAANPAGGGGSAGPELHPYFLSKLSSKASAPAAASADVEKKEPEKSKKTGKKTADAKKNDKKPEAGERDEGVVPGKETESPSAAGTKPELPANAENRKTTPKTGPAVAAKMYGIVEEMAVQDAVSYVVALGIVDKVAQYIACVQVPIEGDSAGSWDAGLIAAICGSPGDSGASSGGGGGAGGMHKMDTLSLCKFVRDTVAFVTAMTRFLGDVHPCPITADGARNIADSTNLVPTVQLTELVSCVSLLYVLVVHQQSRPAPENGGPVAPFTNEALDLVCTVTGMLNAVARLHPYMLQNVLGSEGLNLQFRHIASFLLWYCTQWQHGDDAPVKKEELLNSVIWLIGYFAVGNTENQSMIQSGQMPSVLHQLCSLPLPYFTDNARKKILYPTLIACTLDNPANTEVVEEEVTAEVLRKYLRSDEASTIHLIGVIKGHVQLPKLLEKKAE